MIGKRFSKRWILTWLLWLVLFIPTFWFFYGRYDAREDRIREMEVKTESLRKQEAARAEALHRNTERKKNEIASGPDPSLRVPPTDAVNRPAPALPGESASVEVVDSVEVVTSGPYKGMTVEAAKAAANKELADVKAWYRRKRAYDQRYSEYAEKVKAHTKAFLASADAELETMISVYALMSPEQLEYARQEAFKTLPAEKVEAFFNDLANHRTTKTPEELTKDAQDILKSRKALKIIDAELDVEREQLALEAEELDRTKPTVP